MTTGRGVIYKKYTVEDCYRLSIFDLNRKGMLSKVMRLKLEQGTIARVLFTLETPIRQEIILKSTLCYFGGLRWWFTCPGCDRRAGVLYRAPFKQEYRCLKCSNLSYTARQLHRDYMEGMWRILMGRKRAAQILDGVGQKGFSKREMRQLRRLEARIERPAREFSEQYARK